MRKVFVAIPTHSGILCEQTLLTLKSFHIEAQNNGWPLVECRWAGDSLIAHARNALVGKFLETDCTDLLWLDSDISVGVGIFTRLIMHNVDMVGVAYRLKKDEEEYVVNYLDRPELIADKATGLLEVRDVPFGLVRMRRKVIEALIEAHPDDWFTVRCGGFKTWCLFNTVLKGNTFWGEDFYFCQQYRDIGGQVWVDADINITHVNAAGTEFVGNYGSWLRNRK